MKLLVDADFVVYKCCAGAETEIDWGDDVILVTSKFSDAYACVERELKKIANQFMWDVPEIILFFSDSINFRKKIQPDYKGHRQRKDIYILGIESSCDDTSAAVLKNDTVLSNKIANQSIHKKYGGVVPELASRAHLSNIIPVIELAIKESGISLHDISAIAFTRGPGLMGSLIVGTEFAKSLGVSLEVPVIEVNHMQAHILSNFIENGKKKPDFPFLGVTISGGHTQFILVEDYFKMKILGETLDDAIGEAFDKCGKKIGLGYPAGPEIDKLSKMGDENKFNFSKPKVEGLNFSFSGLKTNFKRFLEKNLKNDKFFIEKEINNLCASLQLTITEILFEKVMLAAKQKKILNIVFGGGVSANTKIRGIFKNENNLKLYFPKLEYTTDNAAMIAIVGYLKFKDNLFSELNLESKARYSI